MKISIEKNTVIAELEKQVVIGNSTKVKEEVRNHISKDNNNVLLDFSNVQFIDSSGIGAIITILKAVNEMNGKVKIYNPKEDVRKVLNMVRLDQIIDIVSEKDDKLNYVV